MMRMVRWRLHELVEVVRLERHYERQAVGVLPLLCHGEEVQRSELGPYLLEVQLSDILCGSWPWMRIEHSRARFPWIAEFSSLIILCERTVYLV